MFEKFASSNAWMIWAAYVLVLLTATPAGAQVEVEIFPTDVTWSVAPPFSNDKNARTNISGAACTKIGERDCIAVNDTSTFVEAFTLGTRAIRPAAIFPLQAELVDRMTFVSVDAQGAAFDGNEFYVVGSRAKASPLLPEKDFLAFRANFNVRQPAPDPAPQFVRSLRLREALNVALESRLFGPTSLSPAAFFIEGVAVKNGRMFVGFRAPSLSKGAYLISVDVAAVFGTGNLNTQVKRVELGEGVGIRDLAAVSTGLLLLGGSAADQPGAPSLFHFNLDTGSLTKLGDVVDPTNRRAKTLLVLQEDPEFLRFLLLFEGIANGGPTEYFVPR